MTSALFAATLASATSLSLYRGSEIGEPSRYWPVTDTFLSSTEPFANFGRDPLLSGGPRSPILIHFGDIARILKGKRVEAAELTLNQEIGAKPELAGAYVLQKRWGEGPDRRGPKQFTVAYDPMDKSPVFAATWNARIGGKRGEAWQVPGGLGPSDAIPLSGVSLTQEGSSVKLGGLAGVVNAWAARPERNYGLALVFKSTCDFTSSEGLVPEFRPRFTLALSPKPIADLAEPDLSVEYVRSSLNPTQPWPTAGTKTEWTVVTRNRGAKPSGNARLSVFLAGKTVAELPLPSLTPDAEREDTFQVVWPSDFSDPRFDSLTVTAESDADGDVSNNTKQTWLRALPVSLVIPTERLVNQPDGQRSIQTYTAAAQEAEDWLNESAIPSSRFSFAPDGLRARIRLEAVTAVDSRVVRLKSNVRVLDISASKPNLRSVASTLLEAAGCPSLDPRRESEKPDPKQLDPFAGMMGGGDTRDDTDLPTILGLVREPWFDPFLSAIPAPSTDLLAGADGAVLEARTLDPSQNAAMLVPKKVLLRILDGNGNLSSGTVLKMPNGNLVKAPNGLAELPADLIQTPSAGGFAIAAANSGGEDSFILKTWQITEAYGRGNRDSALLSYRVNLPAQAINHEVNLALDKFLSSNVLAGSTLAQIVDGKPSTGAVWSAGRTGSIEIDLKKDRELGEVELVLGSESVWSRFSIYTIQTGQNDRGVLWRMEPYGTASLIYRGKPDNGVVRYRLFGPPARAKAIRIAVDRCSEDVDLREVRVYAVKEPGT